MAITQVNEFTFAGLSTDTKPTNWIVKPSAKYFEYDSGDVYEYDGDSWNIKQTRGTLHVKASARNASPVTPHDTNPNDYDALWIGVAGDVAVRLKGDSSGSVTFTGVPAGWFQVDTRLVMATGTTASAIIGVQF